MSSSVPGPPPFAQRTPGPPPPRFGAPASDPRGATPPRHPAPPAHAQAGRAGRAARVCWLLFRVAALVFAVAMVGQPVAMGFFLDGHWNALAVHQAIGISLVLVSWALAVCSVLAWRPARGPVWIAALGLLVAVLIPVQLGMGFARVTAIHLPLGVSLVVIAIVLLVRSWRPVPEPRPGSARGPRR